MLTDPLQLDSCICPITRISLESLPEVASAELSEGAEKVEQEEAQIEQQEDRLHNKHDLDNGVMVAFIQPQPAVVLCSRRHIIWPQGRPASGAILLRERFGQNWRQA